MVSRYRLQIVDLQTGKVVVGHWEPGLSDEFDFITDCVKRALRKGVGFFRTEKHVAQDVCEAIEEAIFSHKQSVTVPPKPSETLDF